MAETHATDLRETPLNALHRKLGARMVPFAGYDMPVQYPSGILTEHNHCREKAALFDVSHMGQAKLIGEGADEALEALVPGAIKELEPGAMRYTLLTNEAGGILDDLMLTRFTDHLFLVVNAACKEADFAHIESHLPEGVRLEILDDHALIALQGPRAASVLGEFAPPSRHMIFLTGEKLKVADIPCTVTRSGYTGEDGFEISVPSAEVDRLARLLLDHPDVEPVGLGARDSLRLEAGLCLYGQDIDTGTTPVEAGLTWTIGKRRRQEGGFPGADVILGQLKDKPARKLVGIKPDGRAPARAGTEIQDGTGRTIGKITSGGFGPTVGGPVALGYVETEFSAPDTTVQLVVRGKALPAHVTKNRFITPRYVKG
ncbi:MAG: glycine cleavage system aminomethyltransferase GcvT [Magnetovibrionaceae bacterium]